MLLKDKSVLLIFLVLFSIASTTALEAESNKWGDDLRSKNLETELSQLDLLLRILSSNHDDFAKELHNWANTQKDQTNQQHSKIALLEEEEGLTGLNNLLGLFFGGNKEEEVVSNELDKQLVNWLIENKDFQNKDVLQEQFLAGIVGNILNGAFSLIGSVLGIFQPNQAEESNASDLTRQLDNWAKLSKQVEREDNFGFIGSLLGSVFGGLRNLLETLAGVKPKSPEAQTSSQIGKYNHDLERADFEITPEIRDKIRQLLPRISSIIQNILVKLRARPAQSKLQEDLIGELLKGLGALLSSLLHLGKKPTTGDNKTTSHNPATGSSSVHVSGLSIAGQSLAHVSGASVAHVSGLSIAGQSLAHVPGVSIAGASIAHLPGVTVAQVTAGLTTSPSAPALTAAPTTAAKAREVEEAPYGIPAHRSRYVQQKDSFSEFLNQLLANDELNSIDFVNHLQQWSNTQDETRESSPDFLNIVRIIQGLSSQKEDQAEDWTNALRSLLGENQENLNDLALANNANHLVDHVSELKSSFGKNAGASGFEINRDELREIRSRLADIYERFPSLDKDNTDETNDELRNQLNYIYKLQEFLINREARATGDLTGQFGGASSGFFN